MINSTISDIRLDEFILMYIQKNGMPFVVDNYCPLREAYYSEKETREISLEGENSNV